MEGHTDPAFRGVEEAFRENFRSRGEVGGAVCVRVDGRPVVDLWGGHRDAARTAAWERDTLVNAYSVGKGIAAMLVLSLVERGELELDAPIATVWPEFAVEGKSRTTLRILLSHQAGLPGVRRTLAEDAMFDWQVMTGALAAQAPYWEPGSAHGYHVNTHGFLVGEPVCRRLGLRFRDALQDRICRPRAADFHVGLPDSEHARVARIVEPERAESDSADNAADAADADNANNANNAEDANAEPGALAREHFGSGDDDTDAMLGNVYFNPRGLSGFGIVNRADWRRASIPSTNSHGTARAVAALYDTFMRLDPAQGGFVGPGLRAEATSIVSDGIDRVLGKPSRFGLGFQLAQPTRPIGGSPSGYGHFGYGGTLGFADPESGVTFGYLMNRPGERWQTPRTNALVEAVYEALGRSVLRADDTDAGADGRD